MADIDQSSALAAAAAKFFAKPFNAVIQLAPDDSAPLWVDGRAATPTITNAAPANGKPDCTWRGAPDIVLRALSGERALESTFVSGRIAIDGDMSVMARLRVSSAT